MAKRNILRAALHHEVHLSGVCSRSIFTTRSVLFSLYLVVNVAAENGRHPRCNTGGCRPLPGQRLTVLSRSVADGVHPAALYPFHAAAIGLGNGGGRDAGEAGEETVIRGERLR